MKKDLIYALTCLSFSIVIGGAVYEHLCVVPQWAAAPPVSLYMFQGEYGLKPEIFWMVMHAISLVLFTTSFILHYKTAKRKFIGVPFLSYVLILVITSIYFVPELLAITTTEYSTITDAELTKRAGMWEALSLVRLGFLLVLAITLFMGLTKPNTVLAGTKSKRIKLVVEQMAEVVAG